MMIINIANMSISIFIATQTTQFWVFNFLMDNILSSFVILLVIFILFLRCEQPVPLMLFAAQCGSLISVLMDISKLEKDEYMNNLKYHVCVLIPNICFTLYLSSTLCRFQWRRNDEEQRPLVVV